MNAAIGPIEAVVFDVGGVLCPSPVDEFAKVDTEHGLRPGTAMSFFRGGALFTGCELGRLPLPDFFDQCVAQIRADQGIDVPPARLDAMLAACMGDALRPDVLALVREIKDAGHRIALLTNIFAERRAWLHGLLPAGTVDVYADSSELGLRKPDQPIYDWLVAALACPPERVAYVDDFAENLVPAERMGMRTVLFESPEQVRRDLVAAGVRIPAAVQTVEVS